MREKYRFRLTVVVTREYVADPASYGTNDPQEMIDIDRRAIEDDPFVMMDHEDAQWDIDVDDITKLTTDQQEEPSNTDPG